MNPTFSIGPLTFHGYGFILGIAMVAGWGLAERLARQQNISEQVMQRVFGLGVIGGIVGARLYHVIDYWTYYQAHLQEIVFLWQGGLGIWGAVIGGMVGLVMGSPKSLRFTFFDIGATVLPLSQAIGRVGNYLNQELFGKPTHLPWGLYISPESRPIQYLNVERFHPLFFYELILNLVLFGILWRKSRQGNLGTGKPLGIYLIGYGVIRFMLEPLRIESWMTLGIPTAWWVSGAAILGGVALVFRVGLNYGKKAEAGS